MQPLVIQLNKGSMNGIEEFESEEENDARSTGLDVNDSKHIYHDKTWMQDHSTYDPNPIEFGGISNTMNFWNALPK